MAHPESGYNFVPPYHQPPSLPSAYDSHGPGSPSNHYHPHPHLTLDTTLRRIFDSLHSLELQEKELLQVHSHQADKGLSGDQQLELDSHIRTSLIKLAHIRLLLFGQPPSSSFSFLFLYLSLSQLYSLILHLLPVCASHSQNLMIRYDYDHLQAEEALRKSGLLWMTLVSGVGESVQESQKATMSLYEVLGEQEEVLCQLGGGNGHNPNSATHHHVDVGATSSTIFNQHLQILSASLQALHQLVLDPLEWSNEFFLMPTTMQVGQCEREEWVQWSGQFRAGMPTLDTLNHLLSLPPRNRLHPGFQTDLIANHFPTILAQAPFISPRDYLRSQVLFWRDSREYPFGSGRWDEYARAIEEGRARASLGGSQGTNTTVAGGAGTTSDLKKSKFFPLPIRRVRPLLSPRSEAPTEPSLSRSPTPHDHPLPLPLPLTLSPHFSHLQPTSPPDRRNSKREKVKSVAQSVFKGDWKHERGDYLKKKWEGARAFSMRRGRRGEEGA